MQRDSNPNATGYDSQWNWIQIQMESDTTPNGSGYEFQWNWILHMELDWNLAQY